MKQENILKQINFINVIELLLVVLYSWFSGLLLWKIINKLPQVTDLTAYGDLYFLEKFHISYISLAVFLTFVGIIGFVVVKKYSSKSLIYSLIFLLLISVIGVNFNAVIESIYSIKFLVLQKIIHKFFMGETVWFWQNCIFIMSYSYFLVLSFVMPLENKTKLKWNKYLIYVLMIIAMVLYGLMSCYRHYRFGSFSMDLGGYDQMIWSYSQLKFIPSTIYEWGINLLGDHFEPILLLITPLYWIKNSVYTLLIFQVILVCSGAIPIYFLAKKKLSSDFAAFCFAYGYLFFIGVQDALWFDFHPLTLTPALIAWILYFLEDKKYLWYWITLFVLLSCKETVSIYIFFIGLYILIAKKEKKLALITMAIGIAWYFFAIKFVIGYLFHGTYRYIGAYATLGSNPLEIFISIVKSPLYILKILFSPDQKVETWFGLFGSFGFFSLLSPLSLVMALPMLGEKFLSARENYYMMWWHYSCSITPILIYSAINGVNALKTKIKNNFNIVCYSGLIVVFSVSLIAFIHYYKTPGSLLSNVFSPGFYKLDNSKYDDINEAIEIIPKNASVLTQDRILPHISHRDKIYDLYPDPKLRGVDYVLFSKVFGCWEVPDYKINKFIDDLNNNQDYQVIYKKNETILYKKVK